MQGVVGSSPISSTREGPGERFAVTAVASAANPRGANWGAKRFAWLPSCAIRPRAAAAGTQFTSIRYGHRLADAGAVASIGSVGDSYDNAMAERVIGLHKTECVRHEGPWRGVDDLELWVGQMETNRERKLVAS
jgi:transposase InsO family protein